MPENPPPPIPPDDLTRTLTLARPNTDQNLPHIGLVGDTYTITVSGADTAGRFCVIDMHIPPGGGPPPHRHDFEETFILLEGELEATFRGQKSVVRAARGPKAPGKVEAARRAVVPRAFRQELGCPPFMFLRGVKAMRPFILRKFQR